MSPMAEVVYERRGYRMPKPETLTTKVIYKTGDEPKNTAPEGSDFQCEMSTKYSLRHPILPGTEYYEIDRKKVCPTHYERIPTIDRESIEQYLKSLEHRPYIKVLEVKPKKTQQP